MRRAASLIAVLSLSACDVPTNTPAPVDRAATPAGPAVKSGPFDVTERGVGPLGGATPFTAEAVRAAYADAKVDAAFLSGLGENGRGSAREPVLNVRVDASGGLEIQSDVDGTIAEILVLGGPFVGPGGERLLTPWAETGFRREQCRAGEGRWRGNAVCRRPEGSRVRVAFAVPGWTGTELPPESVLRERAKVAAFHWSERPR